MSHTLPGRPADTTRALAPGTTLTFDVPAHLLPSRTRGHHHLYLNSPMRWGTYKRLLKTLAKAGVVDPKWARASIKGRQSLLRPPGAAYNEWADPALVHALNPSHVDIHARHIMVRNEEREERDAYTVHRYTVLAPTTDRTRADYVTSELLGSRLHAPALDIDTPATLTPDPDVPGRTHLTVSPGRILSAPHRQRLTRALAKAGLTRLPAPA